LLLAGVRLSVTLMYCIQTPKDIVILLSQPSSNILLLVFELERCTLLNTLSTPMYFTPPQRGR